MKRKILKLFFCIIYLSSFVGCYTLSKMYTYKEENLSIYDNYKEYIYIEVYMKDETDERSPISLIEIEPLNFAGLKKSKKVELLNEKISVEYNGKRYSLKVIDRTAVLPYKEGVILNEGTVVYFGKVKVDDKIIIDMPPVKLKQYLKVVKFNPVAGGLNIDTKKEIYYGPVEGYKGR